MRYLPQKSLFVLAVCILIASAVFGQAGQGTWQYTARFSDFAWDIAPTSDGGYVVAGGTTSWENDRQAWIFKVDSGGHWLWGRALGGASTDSASAIVELPGGNIAVAAGTTNYGEGGWDVWVFVLDSSGNYLWGKTLGGTGTDSATDIIVTSGGNLLITGHSRSFGIGDADSWLTMMTPDGSLLWSTLFGGSGWDSAVRVLENSAVRAGVTEYAVAGYTDSWGAGQRDLMVAWFDAGGTFLRHSTIGGENDDYGRDLILTQDGSLLVVGRTASFGEGAVGEDDLLALKMDWSGTLDWVSTYGLANLSESPKAVHQTSNGQYVLAGSQTVITKSKAYGDTNAFVMRILDDGALDWFRYYGEPETKDFLNRVIELPDSSLLAMGYTSSFGAQEADAWVLNPDANGHLDPLCEVGTNDSPNTSIPVPSVDTTSPGFTQAVVPVMHDVPDPSNPADANEVICPEPPDCTITCDAWADPPGTGRGRAVQVTGYAPLTVQFRSDATPTDCVNPVSYNWDFGNGDTSPEQEPLYTFNDLGTYTVGYTASADGTTCTSGGTVEVLPLPGDCDGNGTVTIGEVQRAINMFLGAEPIACGVDGNGDGTVSIGEVQRVINAFLGVAK